MAISECYTYGCIDFSLFLSLFISFMVPIFARSLFLEFFFLIYMVLGCWMECTCVIARFSFPFLYNLLVSSQIHTRPSHIRSYFLSIRIDILRTRLFYVNFKPNQNAKCQMACITVLYDRAMVWAANSPRLCNIT